MYQCITVSNHYHLLQFTRLTMTSFLSLMVKLTVLLFVCIHLTAITLATLHLISLLWLCVTQLIVGTYVWLPLLMRLLWHPSSVTTAHVSPVVCSGHDPVSPYGGPVRTALVRHPIVHYLDLLVEG